MIHQYKLNGFNVVLDVFSGAVHSVDELAYDIIALFEACSEEEIVRQMLEKYAGDPEISREEISDCIADVKELKDDGQLFTEDSYESHACDFKNKSQAIKALCLHVAHTCNLSCEYCFAAQGKYHGERAVMSFEVGKQALDFLISNSGNQKNLEVDFFGGEPLMNWEVCKQLVAYGRSREAETGKKFRFTLTTNGLLVDDDVIEFANREMNNVVLSLDGREEIHDRLRKTPNGKGSYEIIVPKFQKFAKMRGKENITFAAPLPITTLSLQRIYFTWRTWASRHYQWSRWSVLPKTLMRSRKKTYRFFLSNMKFSQKRCSSVKARGEASPSITI